MDVKRIVLSGVAAGVIILVVSLAISTLTQAIFDYDVLALAGMRSMNDSISILFFLHPFVLGLVMATLYAFARKSFSGTALRKGVTLGLLGWLVYAIPSAFIVFASMNYPIGFTVNSVIGPLISMLGGGITITTISK